jgi:hypothetical protein
MRTGNSIPSFSTFSSSSSHVAVEGLADRTSTAASADEGSNLQRWLLAAVAVFLIWRVWRGFKSLFWTLFGLGMAIFWSGAWRGWF